MNPSAALEKKKRREKVLVNGVLWKRMKGDIDETNMGTKLTS